MEILSRLEQANDNAAALWLAQARAHGWQYLTSPGFTAVRCARTPDDAHRVVVTRPTGEPGAVEAELTDLLAAWHTVRLTVEDPYGGLDLTRQGCGHGRRMAVMVREPGPLPPERPERPATGSGSGLGSGGFAAEVLTAGEVLEAEALAEAERAIVDGFPILPRQPWTEGAQLPVRLLGEPGCRAWIGRVDGVTAGACLTYDDGHATGVYWVATLPAQRSRGVARAVLRTALAAAHPDRPATLVATELGEPLYRRLGFTELARTRWWTR
ncbi:GNAT family N-acetyltransferase [Kitasatospora sp. NPDC058406]|uniref:GNAT family N-acetyltransferase n=1 Tax=Kitasatospora sp. NPDC058406 TaxID=3346483 RepID=UPI0036520E16